MSKKKVTELVRKEGRMRRMASAATAATAAAALAGLGIADAAPASARHSEATVTSAASRAKRYCPDELKVRTLFEVDNYGNGRTTHFSCDTGEAMSVWANGKRMR